MSVQSCLVEKEVQPTPIISFLDSEVGHCYFAGQRKPNFPETILEMLAAGQMVETIPTEQQGFVAFVQ